jgi:dsDNA-binding SOS-regulon protein
MNKATTTQETKPPILNEEQDSELTLFICENTDGVLDPMEQMTYALNETQVKYGSVVVLKNAP